MIKFVIIMQLLLPCVTFAETKCNVIDYPDHDVVDCNGDEAALITSAQKAVLPQPAPTAAQTVTSQPDADIPASSEASPKLVTPDNAATHQSETQPTSQPAQQDSKQGTILHRQGRQQYQQSLEDSKTARKQLIMEKQQLQTAPPATAPPAPSSSTPN